MPWGARELTLPENGSISGRFGDAGLGVSTIFRGKKNMNMLVSDFREGVKFNMSYGFFVAHFLWANRTFPPISPYQIYRKKHVSSRRSISMFMSNNENQKFTALFSLLKQLRLKDRNKKVDE